MRGFTAGANAADPTDDTVSDWSSPVEFFVGGRPVVNSIGTITSQTPTITWQPVQGASGYELFIATAAAPTVPVLRVNGIGATAYTVSTPLAKGDYRVWVRAINASTGAFSLWSNTVNMLIVENSADDNLRGSGNVVLAQATLPAFDVSEITTSTTIGMMQSLTPTPRQDAEEVVSEEVIVPVEETQEKDEVLSIWDEQIWWDAPQAVIEPVAEVPLTDAPVVEGKSEKTDTAAKAGVLAALLAFTPRSLRRRRQNQK